VNPEFSPRALILTEWTHHHHHQPLARSRCTSSSYAHVDHDTPKLLIRRQYIHPAIPVYAVRVCPPFPTSRPHVNFSRPSMSSLPLPPSQAQAQRRPRKKMTGSAIPIASYLWDKKVLDALGVIFERDSNLIIEVEFFFPEFPEGLKTSRRPNFSLI